MGRAGAFRMGCERRGQVSALQLQTEPAKRAEGGNAQGFAGKIPG